MDHWQALATMTGAVGSFVLVILSWVNANARAARNEHGLDRLQADLEKTRVELRSEIVQTRTELRAEFKSEVGLLRGEFRSDLGQVRSEVASLRDLVYREMVSLHERVAAVEAKRD